MRSVRYVSPFVPAEWIEAHGLVPERIVPAAHGGADQQPGACPFMEDARAEGLDIVTTTCDQARRAAEELPGAFLLNVPHTVTPAARRLYREELRRLSKWLVARGGEVPPPERLAAVMAEHDEARARLRAERFRVRGRGVPVALVGGPLWGPHAKIPELVEAAGGEVVLDGTETGERGLVGPFEPVRLAADPFAELVDAYFHGLPDAFRRPNDDLYRWLARGIEERGVKGIVFVRCVWCDLWHAELARLREFTDRPVADVDLDGEPGALPRLLTRIQALLDAIR